jgi:hypothetical protein
LGELFLRISSIDEIPDRLKLYDRMRDSMAERIHRSAMDTGDTWHLNDGEKQMALDAAMKKAAAMANGTGW